MSIEKKNQKADQTLIDISGISRVYTQGDIEVKALRGIDLQIHHGEFTALAGPSGSGKTTLLNMIGCLDIPTAGNIHIDGTKVTDFSRDDASEYRLNHVGFVFQAYNLIPVLSAYENAEFILMMQKVPLEERRNIVIPLLKRVGLEECIDRKPNELSGGQQQRVAVVRALASKPRIVLADEPTANLDSETSAELLDLMAELNEELGITFLFSTHDPQLMERSRRVVHLKSGKIDFEETKS